MSQISTYDSLELLPLIEQEVLHINIKITMLKSKFIIVLSIFLVSFSIYSKLDEYKKALSIITESKEYNSLVKKRKKYNISNELITYSKMAWHFKRELSSLAPISEEQIILDSDKDNLINDELSKLNVKNCSKVQIYFSEIKNDIFFAEIIKTKHKLKYHNRPHFGNSYIYMFKIDNLKVELVNSKELFYN